MLTSYLTDGPVMGDIRGGSLGLVARSQPTRRIDVLIRRGRLSRRGGQLQYSVALPYDICRVCSVRCLLDVVLCAVPRSTSLLGYRGVARLTISLLHCAQRARVIVACNVRRRRLHDVHRTYV